MGGGGHLGPAWLSALGMGRGADCEGAAWPKDGLHFAQAIEMPRQRSRGPWWVACGSAKCFIEFSGALMLPVWGPPLEVLVLSGLWGSLWAGAKAGGVTDPR